MRTFITRPLTTREIDTGLFNAGRVFTRLAMWLLLLPCLAVVLFIGGSIVVNFDSMRENAFVKPCAQRMVAARGNAVGPNYDIAGLCHQQYLASQGR